MLESSVGLKNTEKKRSNTPTSGKKKRINNKGDVFELVQHPKLNAIIQVDEAIDEREEYDY